MAKEKFTIEEKQVIVKYHLENKKKYGNWTLRQTANAYNVNHQTIKNWVDIYQKQRLEGLIDKRTGNYRLSVEEGINKEILKLNKMIKKQKRELKQAKVEKEIVKKWTAFLNTEKSKKEW